MKIILSRKGFDSANGGIVSPIFEDGTMVSFPIPSDDEDTYDSLYYNGIQYSQILRDLQYKGGDHCHLDPDLDLGRRRERIDGWFPAFGQRNAAAAYLKNIGVAQGDIFLFFGNFHFVEYQNGTYRYLRDRSDFYRGKDLQVIWGYLQVGEIISVPEEQRKVWWHPHSSSMTIAFSANEEILNTDESVATFCEKLEMIIDQHSFINQLDSRNYTRRDVEGIIAVCDTEITESIERLNIFNDTRDGVSRRILRRLDDLCSAALLLNAIDAGIDTPTLPLAWERSLLDIETKYLGTFLKGLQYIGKRIPDEGQSERLMLKYYEFLWQIRKSLKEKYEIDILSNLEKFPLHIDQIDRQYYELAAMAVIYTR